MSSGVEIEFEIDVPWCPWWRRQWGGAAPRGQIVDGVGRMHKITGWCLWVIGGGRGRAISMAAAVEGRGEVVF
jgi:hypothetical protein